ncbi:hypothetical protein [Okeania sp. KiyG1]|uniref:hypothetical protein n=1 Tax=Okeania sp. KiyG1 TaxID=2720165 RepID=UPI001921D74F|nr:hypothetical protein [Okeania sp. KiyG1]GGA13940.1 hypothetical protein CYANOKiyG1_27450 [Okeania sp. KiyG1]
MPRGKHRHGYNWNVPDKDKTNVKVPKEIMEEVQQFAQELWEQRKRSEEQMSQSVQEDSDNA